MDFYLVSDLLRNGFGFDALLLGLEAAKLPELMSNLFGNVVASA